MSRPSRLPTRWSYAGIAGDYCVLETLRNIVALRDSTLGIKVFVQGVASIDGGKALADYMSQTGIEEYIA